MSDPAPVAESSKAGGAPHGDDPDLATLVGPADDDEIENFLGTWKPSSKNNELPWYWVRIPIDRKDTKATKDEEIRPGYEPKDDTFKGAGEQLVKRLTDECERIKIEAPIRANKAKGLRSQKECKYENEPSLSEMLILSPTLTVREEEHAKFNSAVRELAQKHNLVSGKWLLYPTDETVDGTWAKVVRALAAQDGALAQTGSCHVAKVSTTPTKEGAPFVICVYSDDSYNKDGVGSVFRALVNDLGLVSSAYKTDANTILKIDSNHPSKIKSSLYGKNDFMTKEEIEEAMAARSKARPVKTLTRTTEEEQDDGGAGFAPLSDSEDDEKPPPKKSKRRRA
ncbi:hypothetical protein OIV83_003374 [Microbotryomycetes sp. JL201]|nr:hypothetical protein OIV83_003374 [Microbotryomycetes sp. JL201]